MSYYHSIFSVGAVLGALVGSAVMAAGITLPWVLAIVGVGQALTFLVIGAVTWRRVVPAAQPAETEPTEPPGGLGLLYLLGLCATVGEVAVTGWSALYLRRELHVPPHVAPYGYAAFALAMTVGRLCGSGFVARFGSVRVLCWSGLLATVGLAGIVLLATPGLVIAAFGVAGAGVACVFPLLLSAAARTASAQPGRTMARMVLCTQVGTLASPLLLGSAVKLATIRAAFAGPAVAYLVIALGARHTRSAT